MATILQSIKSIKTFLHKLIHTNLGMRTASPARPPETNCLQDRGGTDRGAFFIARDERLLGAVNYPGTVLDIYKDGKGKCDIIKVYLGSEEQIQEFIDSLIRSMEYWKGGKL